MSHRQIIGHLRGGGTSVVFVGDGGLPELAYWGSALADDDIEPGLFSRPVVGGGLDVDPPPSIITESSRGWFGRPGIEGHRADGGDFAPRFTRQTVESTDRSIRIVASDEHAQLELAILCGLDEFGVLEMRATVTNVGSEPYDLQALRLTLPVPAEAGELMTLVGRHALEFCEQRTPWSNTCVTVENRHGKTSHERSGVVFAGTPGFGEHHGDVWGVHIGWSGNYEFVCDAITDARRVLQVGELLLPGEVALAAGASYSTPPVFGAYSNEGLNRVSNRFHDHLRARPGHPKLPRPVHLNTWEAVYFDHDLEKLRRLADRAAAVGIDRFVLDDGWFGSRRDDHRGLGDWWVSEDAWPNGLAPLIDHVRGLGMEFGIWVEPEMVSPDSELFRNHPEWALVDQRYALVTGRSQLVLDVGRPEVQDYLFEHLDALLRDHEISYLKWDHNRDLVSPTSGRRAGVHRQTLGLYALLDRLRAAHPGVDIETCASGGGRVDFGILDHTDRAWTSDSIDALDRHRIQRGFSLLFPPEIMGTHIGSGVTHATRRSHRLGFRGVAALFGSMGVEWDLLEASPEEIDHLTDLVGLHKRFSTLLHTGDVIRVDHPDPSVEVHGVLDGKAGEGLFAVTRLWSNVTHHTAPLRLPRLDPDATYELSLVSEVAEPIEGSREQPSWTTAKLVATGGQLMHAGLSLPQLLPESSVVLHLTAAGGEG